MGKCRKHARSLRVLLPVVVGVAALFAVSKGPVAQISEMDGFERAVTSASKADALAFIHEFSSSHLIPDLIELLPADVAAAVCADLGSSVGSAPKRACQQATILGTAPSAGPMPAASELATTEEVTTVEEDEGSPAAVGLQHDTSGNEGDKSNGRTSIS